jgi:hypothetical protein
VDRDDLSAEFWLDQMVQANDERLLEAWHGYFGSSGG